MGFIIATTILLIVGIISVPALIVGIIFLAIRKKYDEKMRKKMTIAGIVLVCLMPAVLIAFVIVQTLLSMFS